MNNHPSNQSPPTPHRWIWLGVFGYTALVAMAVQFVLLPLVFPQWHAGNGLLVNGDWLSHHEIASKLAQAIREQGWHVWDLYPQQQGVAGIAAAVYALTTSEPWMLIPINAALHATAALGLLKIVQIFLPNWRYAIWGVVPFVLFPSAMLWTTQILKDSYSISGAMLFLWGWLLALGAVRHQKWFLWLGSGVLVLAGVSLCALVRPYLVQLFQAVSVGFALAITSYAIFQWKRLGAFSIGSVALASALLVLAIAPLAFGPFVVNQAPESTANNVARVGEARQNNQTINITWQWGRTEWMPAIIENRFYTLAGIRFGFVTSYPKASANVDNDVVFESSLEMLAYTPRALQLSLFSPFLTTSFEPTTSSGSTMRKVASIEMIVVYIAYIGLLFALWFERGRLELWMILGFCIALLIILGWTVTNIGTIYRMRYAYVMLLVALGMVGWIKTAIHMGWTIHQKPKEGT